MEKKKSTFVEFLHSSNWRTFLLCLLFTFLLWVIVSLSAKKNVKYYCPVQYVGYDKQQYALSADTLLTMNIEATGFEHLHSSFWAKKPTIDIDLQQRLHPNRKAIAVQDFAATILNTLGFGEDKKITFFKDTIHLTFEKRESKKVKVDISNLKISFKAQYGIYGLPKVNPDSITIYGNAENLKIINTIQILDTKIDNVSEDKTFEVALKPIWNKFIDVYPDKKKVKISFQTERYTEVKYTIPINFVSEDTSIHAKLYPQNVEATCKIALKDYKSLTPDKIKVNVFYDKLQKNDSLPVLVSSFPQYVHISKIAPQNVSYIIIK